MSLVQVCFFVWLSFFSKSFDKNNIFFFAQVIVKHSVISYIFANNFRKNEAMKEENFQGVLHAPMLYENKTLHPTNHSVKQ